MENVGANGHTGVRGHNVTLMINHVVQTIVVRMTAVRASISENVSVFFVFTVFGE